MRARKAKKRPETPEHRFRRKLMEECRIVPGMMVKAERMPQGSMEYYRVRYIPASVLEVSELDFCLQSLWGEGSCLLRFVDEARQPMDEYGSMWIHLGDYDDLDDRLEEAQVEVIMALSEAQNENQPDKTIAASQGWANLMPTGRSAFSKLTPATLDALRRYIESVCSNDSNAIHETIRMMSEMREQEYQRTMKQQTDAVKQFLDTMPVEVQAALQAQGTQCQTQTEPVSQGSRFPLGDCSPPIAGPSLERLNTRGILQGLGKPQDRGADDQ